MKGWLLGMALTGAALHAVLFLAVFGQPRSEWVQLAPLRTIAALLIIIPLVMLAVRDESRG